MAADETEFLPCGRQTVDQDDIDAVVRVLGSERLTTGPELERFERALAERVGARAAVAVASGTAALHAACFAADVGIGDQVIVPAISFLATANCARYLNAEPVFADVDPGSGLISVAAVERRLSPATRAVIPVHLNGSVADLEGIADLTTRRGICVIEAAAHALGAERSEVAVGACDRHSDMATCSFHPVEHITAGEGGAVSCRDPEHERRLRLFRNHGMERDPARLAAKAPGPWYFEQQVLGHDLRMSDLQAALALSQLAKLERFLAQRRVLAARYDALLAELRHVEPAVPASLRAGNAYHLYPVLIPFRELGLERAVLIGRLHALGIGTQVHYIPLPMQPYYASRGWRIEDFPGASRYYERVLSLPIFPAMSEAQVDRVADALFEELRGFGAE